MFRKYKKHIKRIKVFLNKIEIKIGKKKELITRDSQEMPITLENLFGEVKYEIQGKLLFFIEKFKI